MLYLFYLCVLVRKLFLFDEYSIWYFEGTKFYIFDKLVWCLHSAYEREQMTVSFSWQTWIFLLFDQLKTLHNSGMSRFFNEISLSERKLKVLGKNSICITASLSNLQLVKNGTFANVIKCLFGDLQNVQCTSPRMWRFLKTIAIIYFYCWDFGTRPELRLSKYGCLTTKIFCSVNLWIYLACSIIFSIETFCQLIYKNWKKRNLVTSIKLLLGLRQTFW